MTHSMTGFGKATAQWGGKKITVELKSLNSKGFDLFVKIPGLYRECELTWRNKLSLQLERGKVDFSIYIENLQDTPPTQLNAGIVKAYMQQLQQLQPEANPTELLKMAVRMPEVLKTEREELNPEEAQAVEALLDQAIVALRDFRHTEGQVLAADLLGRIGRIRQLAQEVLPFEAQRVVALRQRFQTALQDLQAEPDANRFEQELIFYLEKWDITEEKVRLNNHLDYFEQTLNAPEHAGRKLAFISQEIGREINTLGSKANQADMQRIVVLMKDELEKIKEQLLNIL